jgi:HAAS domain-containing protein
MDPETLVRDYLGRLDAATAHLAADRRAELLDEVRDHIELALAEAGRIDKATVHNVLDRLGSPSEIVMAEANAPMPGRLTDGTEPTSSPSRALSVETQALILLTVGAVVLPFVGPILGLWFVSASNRWTLAQKRTATMVVLVLLAMPVYFLVPALASGEITWVFSSGGFMIPFVPLAGIVAATYLVVSTSVVLTISRRELPPRELPSRSPTL